MKSHVRILIYSISIILLIGGCSSENDALDEALQSITPQDLASDIQILASDEFEGRGPATRGEEKTIQFLKEEFEKLGLQPGNGNSYFQEVQLVEITTDSNTRLTVRGKNKTTQYKYADEFVAGTKQESVQVQNSELVFAGYGIIAPEYGWNDYADIDVTGKTVVILVNDPGFATQDASLFNGKAMTYYGRYTYKYEEAARQGAIGAFVVHETDAAGYPWDVLKNSFSRPKFGLASPDDNEDRIEVKGWMAEESARAIFQQAGLDYDMMKEQALKPNFKAQLLGLKASIALNNTIRHVTSNNVLAVLPGRERNDEYLVYMAHWDHFGIDSTLTGDLIYNGALDNATGTAALLELAEAFAKLPTYPDRSLLFLAVTAEEHGLQGAKYYAQNPVYPLNCTVAVINMDGLNIWGPMRDVTIIGYGNSELDDYVIDVASTQGRTVRPDPEPEKGYFYRSDHFNFAKQGVPALFPDAGIDHREHGAEWALKQRDDYVANRYHKPSDEYDPNWDLSGMVEDLKLLFKVGYRLANESTFPNWREGVEFKAKRDADMTRKTL
ncbi:M28 family metallopeptidase, partial [Candidatus Latescibacterota bacterium]